jgi:dephospho-CoA kinase
MKRVLITGMSGTGKSVLIDELAALGYKAVDADSDEWSHWVDVPGDVDAVEPGKDWVWREDLIERLLSTEDAEVLFLSGTAMNMVKFYPQFDYIVLLSASPDVILERLATRTNNRYGKRSEEAARVLRLIETIEPKLRRRATHEIDTSAPLDEVVSTVLHLVGARPAKSA